jgi:O-antigen ligase
VKRVALVVAVVIGMVAFAPPGYFQQMQTILNPQDDYNFQSNNGRKALIERGFKYMMAYPVFGVGIDNFSRAECTPELSGLPAGRLGTRCGAPHNSFMQAGSETGVLGLIAYSSIVLGGVWALLRFRRRLPRRWRRGAQAERFLYNAPTYFAMGLVGFAASSFFVSFAWMEVLYLLAAMITGFYVSVKVYADASAANPASPALSVRRAPGWRVAESARRNGVPPQRALPARTG